MEDIFCRIAKGEIPCSKIYEDDDVLAFLDLSQLGRGHTLVIPKRHFENFLECDDELLGKLFKVAKMVGNAQKKAFGAKGVNILSNAGEEAGQSVMHFHIHVIPRFDENDGFSFNIKENPISKEEMSLICEKLKANL